MNAKSTILIVVVVAALITLLSSIFIVPQTHQALVLRFGKPIKVISQPGLGFKFPFVETVEMFDKRLLAFNAEAKELIAADQKRLIVDAFVRYRITNPIKFKQTVGDERTMNSRLNTILESALRQAIGNEPLTAVIATQRAQLMQKVLQIVNSHTSGKIAEGDEAAAAVPKGGFGIQVVDVRIVRADLPHANSESIYRRMQTERDQEAKELRAKGAEEAQKIRAGADKERTVLLADAKRIAEITRGEGDKEATRIFAEAVSRSPEFYEFYRSLQAYRKTITKDNTTVILSPDSQFLKYMEKSQ